jgi:hypothetical protein
MSGSLDYSISAPRKVGSESRSGRLRASRGAARKQADKMGEQVGAAGMVTIMSGAV